MNANFQSGNYYYDLFYSKKGFHHFFYLTKIQKLLNLIPNDKKVLDMGSGSGVFLNEYLNHKLNAPAVDLTGVNINENEINFCKTKFPAIQFVQGDIKTVNLNQQYEVVNISDVLEHFQNDEIASILNNIDQHLMKNGLLLIAVPTLFYLKIVEKIWVYVRKIIYPNEVFDDDDVHRYLLLNRIKKKCLKNYTIIKRGQHMGLIKYILLKKS